MVCFFMVILVSWLMSRVWQFNSINSSFFLIYFLIDFFFSIFAFNFFLHLVSWLWIRFYHLFWFVFYKIILISWLELWVLWVDPSRFRLFYNLMIQVNLICCRLNIFLIKQYLLFFLVELYFYRCKLFFNPSS